MVNGVKESFTNPSGGWSWSNWSYCFQKGNFLQKIFFLFLGAIYLVLRAFIAVLKVIFVVCCGGLVHLFLTGGRRRDW